MADKGYNEIQSSVKHLLYTEKNIKINQLYMPSTVKAGLPWRAYVSRVYTTKNCKKFNKKIEIFEI